MPGRDQRSSSSCSKSLAGTCVNIAEWDLCKSGTYARITARNIPRFHARPAGVASGAPIDYHNWRTRVWAPLLKKTGPDDENPKRVAIAGAFHMLRHFFVTALIQSEVNAKVAQTLAGHHNRCYLLARFLELLLRASGSKTVAEGKSSESRGPQLSDLNGAPAEIQTSDPWFVGWASFSFAVTTACLRFATAVQAVVTSTIPFEFSYLVAAQHCFRQATVDAICRSD
jgi:hypothetical protein